MNQTRRQLRRRGIRSIAVVAWIAAQFGPFLLSGLAVAATNFIAEPALERQFTIRHWTTEEGLPQNTIQCLLQTRDGYLWIGTRDGLVRYDGREFKVFNRSNTPELRSGTILSLAEAADGTLWIGTGFGVVSHQEGRWSRFEHPGGLLENRIFKIACDADGLVWVGSEFGLYTLRGSEWSWQTADDSRNSRLATVTGIVGTADGRIWAGDRVGLLEKAAKNRVFQRRLDVKPGTQFDGANSLVPTGPEELWFTDPNGLYQWNHEVTNRWPVPDPGHLSPLAVRPEGGVWMAFPRLGLGWFDRGEFHFFEPSPQLHGCRFVSLLADRDGCLWLGTETQGLFRLRPRQLMTYTTNDGLSHDDVWSVSEATDGSVWVGTGSGASRWQDGRWHPIRPKIWEGIGMGLVFTSSSGEVWTGTTHLWRWEDGRLEEFSLPPRNSDPKKVFVAPACYYQGHDDTLWFGIGCGVLVQSGSDWISWSLEPPLAMGSLRSILEDARGDLWFGGSHGRVDRLRRQPGFDFQLLKAAVEHDPGSWTNGFLVEHFYPSGSINLGPIAPVLAEADGRVWFCSESGLWSWKEGQFCNVTPEHGLPEALAYNILADDRGWYWLNGNQGVHRVRQQDLRAVADGKMARAEFVSYGEADGMLSAEGNGGTLPNSCKTRDGRLWFPTTKGVVVVDPARLPESLPVPTVVIEQVMVDGEIVYGDGSANGSSARSSRPSAAATARVLTQAGEPPALRLAPGRARALEIRFAAPDPAGMRKSRLQYRLVGHDPDWRDDREKRGLATYTNLQPGSYHFEVRTLGLAGTGPPLTKWAAVSFHLAPHLWQTWPFFGSCAAGLIGIGAGIVYQRLCVHRRLARQEQQRALEHQRAATARDLHDHLGGHLTRLALLADQSATDGNGTPLAHHAREALGSLRELMWASNPHNDALPRLASFLGQQAESLINGAPVRLRLDLPMDLPDLPVSAEMRHALVSATKEALANALNHAGATEIRLLARFERDELLVEVSDDGHGFLTTDSTTHNSAFGGNGLRNLRERLISVGGRCEIESTPELGTRVRLVVQISARCPV